MKLPDHLSYTKSIDPSEALFYYKTRQSEMEPLEISERKINGRQTNIQAGFSKPEVPKSVSSTPSI